MALTLNSGLYIPVELIEPIIAHVGRCSPQDLQSLSLVSKVWAPIAQSILFSTVEIHPDSVQTSPTFFGLSDEYHILRRLGGVPDPLVSTTGTPSQFQHLLETAPHISEYTRHLKFSAGKADYSIVRMGNLHPKKLFSQGIQDVTLRYIVACKKLESLRFEACYWDALEFMHEPISIALRSCQLKYLSLSRVVFPDVLSLSAALMGLLSDCACLETLLLDAIEPQGPLDLSELSFRPRPNSSSPTTLRSFILYSEVLNTFPSLLECLSAQSSPVDVSRLRGLSIICPGLFYGTPLGIPAQFQGEDEAASASTVSFLEKQHHTLEHLSVPQGFLEKQLSCVPTAQLKSLRIIHEELEECVCWLTRMLECGTFPQLTAITIDINGSPRSALYQLGDHDLRKDHWKAFGTASRQVNVEIVRLYVRAPYWRADIARDGCLTEDDFKTFLGAEDRPVFRLVTTSRPL